MPPPNKHYVYIFEFKSKIYKISNDSTLKMFCLVVWENTPDIASAILKSFDKSAFSRFMKELGNLTGVSEFKDIDIEDSMSAFQGIQDDIQISRI